MFVYCFRRAIKLHRVVYSKPEPKPKPESESKLEPKLDHCPTTQLFTQYICVIVPSAQCPVAMCSSTPISVDLCRQKMPQQTGSQSISLSSSLSLSLSALSNSWAWAYLCAWENIRWPQLKVTRLTTTTKCTSIDFPDNTNHNKNIAPRRRRSRWREEFFFIRWLLNEWMHHSAASAQARAQVLTALL